MVKKNIHQSRLFSKIKTRKQNVLSYAYLMQYQCKLTHLHSAIDGDLIKISSLYGDKI
ncbi:hypothetical protein N478_20375 [Pseudoalteromonas luteoviolacea S4060-1]|uniref:Uncharacterized protein n=1 Tax=Pseudoalteromonas luteoviolacea S4060-1 TaxID=1365257 RepID=A0A162CDR6_9GAMM|nr:hypothetical protein N478_20375 [Pseudoalteromonas luteoviolacea S4060-1]